MVWNKTLVSSMPWPLSITTQTRAWATSRWIRMTWVFRIRCTINEMCKVCSSSIRTHKRTNYLECLTTISKFNRINTKICINNSKCKIRTPWTYGKQFHHHTPSSTVISTWKQSNRVFTTATSNSPTTPFQPSSSHKWTEWINSYNKITQTSWSIILKLKINSPTTSAEVHNQASHQPIYTSCFRNTHKTARGRSRISNLQKVRGIS